MAASRPSSRLSARLRRFRRRKLINGVLPPGGTAPPGAVVRAHPPSGSPTSCRSIVAAASPGSEGGAQETRRLSPRRSHPSHKQGHGYASPCRRPLRNQAGAEVEHLLMQGDCMAIAALRTSECKRIHKDRYVSNMLTLQKRSFHAINRHVRAFADPETGTFDRPFPRSCEYLTALLWRGVFPCANAYRQKPNRTCLPGQDLRPATG